MSEQLARDVREFWLDPDRLARGAASSEPIVRQRFAALLEEAAAGGCATWTNSPRRSLSLIILLDQFASILYPDSPRSFTCHERALATALSGIESGADATLTLLERLYYWMPLQRAESQTLQQESLAMFERLAREAPDAQRDVAELAAHTARERHNIVARFGRFPQRNRILGRVTTPAEHAWLTAPDRLPFSST